MLKIFNGLVFLIIAQLASSCAILEPENELKPVPSIQKVYFYPFDQVWRAATLALVAYPIAVNNSDTGTLETDFIKGTEVWKSPVVPESKLDGQKYRIFLNVAKGQTRGKASVRLTISKKIETQKDFFSQVKEKYSDGLEENVILYRIERELVINKAINGKEE